MVRFPSLRTPYALFIIVLMVIGIVAAGFFFYNSAIQNPCGDPGPPKFAPLPDQTITVNGQPKTYTAVAANFTGTQQEEVISSYAFYTTALNDPSFPHMVNGNCASDFVTPATITVKITIPPNGQQESLALTFKGGSQPVNAFTSSGQAGLMWDPSVSLLLELLVAQ